MVASSDIISQPERVVVAGGNTTFTCIYTSASATAEQIQWLVNGTRLEDLNQTERIEAENNIIYFIHIPVEYNGTTIKCIIDYTSGGNVPSNNATILVQGEEKII